MEYCVSVIEQVIFNNKQNIPWNDVEQYLKGYIGQTFVVREYQDYICIASDFPEEFSESKYTKSLRGVLAKVKANAAQIFDLMIKNAVNRRWMETSRGLFLYDVVNIKKEASMPLESDKTVR